VTSGIQSTRLDCFVITSIVAYAKYAYVIIEHSKTLTCSTHIAPILTSEPVLSATAVIKNNIQPVFRRADPDTFTMWIDDGLVDTQPIHPVITPRVPLNVKHKGFWKLELCRGECS
jgi:hypothetical protein